MVWKGAVTFAVGFAILFALFIYKRETAKRTPTIEKVAETVHDTEQPKAGNKDFSFETEYDRFDRITDYTLKMTSPQRELFSCGMYVRAGTTPFALSVTIEFGKDTTRQPFIDQVIFLADNNPIRLNKEKSYVSHKESVGSFSLSIDELSQISIANRLEVRAFGIEVEFSETQIQALRVMDDIAHISRTMVEGDPFPDPNKPDEVSKMRTEMAARGGVDPPEQLKKVNADDIKIVQYKDIKGGIHQTERYAGYYFEMKRENGIIISFAFIVFDRGDVENFRIVVSIDDDMADQIRTNHIGLQVDQFKIRDLTPEPGVNRSENGRYNVTSVFPIEEIWRLSFFDRLRITAGQKTFHASKEEVESIKDFAGIVQKCVSHRPGTPFPLE